MKIIPKIGSVLVDSKNDFYLVLDIKELKFWNNGIYETFILMDKNQIWYAIRNIEQNKFGLNLYETYNKDYGRRNKAIEITK